MRTALFGVEVNAPPLLRPDGSLTHSPKENAGLLADVFDSKQSNDGIIITQSCFPDAVLATCAFRSGVDPYGGALPDDIFPMLFIKSADYIATKISTVFCKLVSVGGFSIC